MPTPARVAGMAPAELQALRPRRTGPGAALRHAAREVASGRVDLRDREQAWRRLRAIPNIGTLDARDALALRPGALHHLALAGDLGYLKLVGRLTWNPGTRRRAPTRPRSVASSERYGEWKGLAGTYLFLAAGAGMLTEPRRSLPG